MPKSLMEGTSCAEDKLGLELEDNFFLRQLFRIVNFLVYRVHSPAAVAGCLHICLSICTECVSRIACCLPHSGKVLGVASESCEEHQGCMHLIDCYAGAQQEVLKALLGDPSFQLDATRYVLVNSLRDFLGGPAFPPPTPSGSTRCCAVKHVKFRCCTANPKITIIISFLSFYRGNCH